MAFCTNCKIAFVPLPPNPYRLKVWVQVGDDQRNSDATDTGLGHTDFMAAGGGKSTTPMPRKEHPEPERCRNWGE